MRHSVLCLVPLAVAVALMQRGVLRAEVIISEIMYNADGADQPTATTNREWAELYNTGSSAVNIGGWQFGDANDNQWASVFPAGTTIQPHQALVVTGDAATFDSQWGTGINRVQVTSFPPLANRTSTVGNVERPAIRNGSQIIDAVQYAENFASPVDPWPMIDDTSNGHSIFVVPQGLSAAANDHGVYWKPSARDVYGGNYRNSGGENYGSPGFVDTVPQAPFAPSPDAAWSMVIMPDTQNYVKNDFYQPLLQKLTGWIRDNRDAYKIQVVLQEGDIVNNNNTDSPSSGNQTSSQQWPAAQAGMFVLNGQVPYIMAAGNHDFGFTNADNRDTMVNNYFKISDNPLTAAIFKDDMVDGDITNAYYAFTAPDGRKMLVFSLEWEPRQGPTPTNPTNPDVVGWANGIAAKPEYAGYTAVLLTHNYLQSNDTRSTTADVAGDATGQMLWDNLIKTHSNFEMVFNGHFGGDGEGFLDSTDNAGKTVHQMFFNTQFETMGGNGWIRLVEFLNDGRTVRVRTYSPLHDLYRTSAAYDFEFQLTPLPPIPGDYNRDKIVNAADYVLWRKSLGSRANLTADGNNDGVITELDYDYWRQRYGNTAASGDGVSLEAVPEPSAGLLLMLAACIFAAFPQRPGCRLRLSSNRARP